MADEYDEQVDDNPYLPPAEEEPLPEEEVEPPIEYSEASANIVLDLVKTKAGREWLEKISGYIEEDFDTAWQATERYRQKMADNWKIFIGDLPPKIYPFKNSANIHVPMTMENTLRLDLRAYGELFGDWTNVFGVVPLGPASDAEAELLTLHGNWQIREELRDFPRQMHRAMLAFFFVGDVTIHSWWNPETKLNVHEVLTPDDFVVPFVHVSTKPDYSDMPWHCKILRKYKHELEFYRDRWYDVDKLLENEPPAFSDEPESKLAEASAETQELDVPDEQRVRAYTLLWYEGFCELPNQSRHRFIQAVVDKDTKHFLMLRILEQPNWKDQLRFERQQMELQAYEGALMMHQQMLQQMEVTKSAIVNDAEIGIGGPMGEQMLTEMVAQEQEQLPIPPAPPWLEDSPDGPELPRQEPVRLFTHGVCIEPFKSNLGIGYGHIQADHNRAVNTMMSQFVDSATLANVSCFVAAGSVKWDRDFVYAPGHVNVAKGTTPDNLKSAFIPISTQPPSGALFQAIQFVVEVSQSSMQSPDVLSGEPGKSGEPFRGLAARIEQASKQLSVITRKFADEVLTQVLRNNAYLNSNFLSDDETIAITNAVEGKIQEIKLSRRMYARDYRVMIRSDLRFTSNAERIAESNELLQMAGQNPFTAQNPAFLHAATKNWLQARGLHQFAHLLGPAPQPGQPPPPPPGQPQPGQAPPNGAGNPQQMQAQQ